MEMSLPKRGDQRSETAGIISPTNLKLHCTLEIYSSSNE